MIPKLWTVLRCFRWFEKKFTPQMLNFFSLSDSRQSQKHDRAQNLFQVSNQKQFYKYLVVRHFKNLVPWIENLRLPDVLFYFLYQCHSFVHNCIDQPHLRWDTTVATATATATHTLPTTSCSWLSWCWVPTAFSCPFITSTKWLRCPQELVRSYDC